MDRYRELLNKPVVIAVLGGLAGLILGLIIGWGIWPVQYYDASPAYLQQGYQEDYLRMTIDSYAKNGDQQLALRRWEDLGKAGPDLLSKVQQNPGTTSLGDLAKFNTLINQGAAAPSQGQPTTAAGTPLPGVVTTPAPAATKPAGFPLSVVLVILCLLMLVIAAALAYMFLFRNKRRPGGGTSVVRQAAESNLAAEKTDYAAQGQETPVAQFMTTYNNGDDLYDDSFSIDAPSGEFLGECGVGISETVGVGDPKKVTAFEVWLFDKNDIQTVTKVLMSDYAFEDPQVKSRLATKGEPILIQPGERILLETATLQLEARVVDMNYGAGPLPENSFFDRLTLELSVWPKPPAA